jgi:hypothetical protein
MTDAPDTAADRLAEYQPLVITALVDRERTGDGIRFPFRADPGLATRSAPLPETAALRHRVASARRRRPPCRRLRWAREDNQGRLQGLPTG